MKMAKSSSLPPRAGIDARSALNLVTEMMAIPGKSCEEGKVVDYIRRRLRKAGIPSSAILTDATPNRSPAGGEVGNLIVKLPGTRRGPRRLLMGHIDTVPICVGAKPVRRGKFIASRDVQTALGGDNRAGASVALNAILEIKRQNLQHPPLTLFWPVQEEIGLYGVRFVSKAKLGNPKLCFNWDGTEPNLAVIGATGDYNMQIEIEGIASHAGGHPEQGVSAIGIAGMAIADLVENGWHGLIVKGAHTGTSNIGLISGGDATNVVTPKVSLQAEARSHDPKFRKRIVEAIRKAFLKAARTLKNDAAKRGTIHFQADLKYEAFRISDAEPCVTEAMAAVEAIGLTPGLRISNGGLDANWMMAHGLPTVTLGCGQHGIHTVNETLEVEMFLEACRIGLMLATDTV